MAELRAEFLADETTASNLSTQAGTAIDRLPSDASASALAAAAGPIVSGGQAYLTQLQHLPWPTNMTSDAKALEEELFLTSNSCSRPEMRRCLRTQPGVMQNLYSQLWGRQRNKLHHDLGLPPITTP
jgi:hypothetical protein